MTSTGDPFHWYPRHKAEDRDDRADALELLDEPDWFTGAACYGSDDPRAFSRITIEQRDFRREYCDSCAVTEACLEAGRYERFGVWGGFTESERRNGRRSTRTLKRADRT